ncbi:MAG: ATP-binding protein [Lachnospiraceae bacterium]|nr:ATP-binding protein [Lachnospiraceae bacterium]
MQGIDESPESIGRIIYSRIRLEDVKLKSRLKEVLNDVITSVRTAHTVLDSWELRKNYHYGTAVSLLLSGPPGTGKTMTANAIAGELGFPLFQVNLSHIVDKYIGETDKNLEKAFAFAEKTNSVLFFDEADSLFGKRSEVKDSHDKYANNEISYLLQRIEAYDGIVILSTNIKGNIDPAFLRRLRYVVHFENPDKEARRAIWESCFDAAVPHEDIDIDYLSEQFDEFTGSVIRTVFLNACSLAAGKNEPLSMSHLIRAIRLELEKTSTVAFSGDTLGKYAYLS